MKKIALVLPEAGPVPAVKGGAIEELLTILVEQNEIEHKVEFMVFCAKDRQAESIAANYKHSRIIYLPKTTVADRLVNRVIRYSNRIFKNKTWIDIAYYRRVFRYLKKQRPDAIVAEGGLYHEFRRFAQEFGKENVYLHIHHQLLCEPYIDHIYGSVIGISQFATNEWMRTTDDTEVKAYTVYNCVNEDKFKKRITAEERESIRNEFGFGKEDTVLLFCGRMIEVKGARELIQAVIRLKRPDIKLLMIGSANFNSNAVTPYVEEVQKLVNEAGEQIRFTGYIENQKLYRYYQAADIQVIPSLWEEAAGLIAIEGMLSGLPLIITKSGGMIEYAPEDVAVWVDRENVVENLMGAIKELADDKEKRKEMSLLSLERAKQFPKKKFYEDFIEVFKHEKVRER